MFADDAISTKSFHLPIRATSDAAGQLVRVDIGDVPGGTPVTLSDACLALHRQGELTGFVVRLA